MYYNAIVYERLLQLHKFWLYVSHLKSDTAQIISSAHNLRVCEQFRNLLKLNGIFGPIYHMLTCAQLAHSRHMVVDARALSMLRRRKRVFSVLGYGYSWKCQIYKYKFPKLQQHAVCVCMALFFSCLVCCFEEKPTMCQDCCCCVGWCISIWTGYWIDVRGMQICRLHTHTNMWKQFSEPCNRYWRFRKMVILSRLNVCFCLFYPF